MTLQTEFVDIVPDSLEPGVLYISMKYATASHLCACGCGDEIVTPLSPVQWKLTYDGENIWLSPSISTGQGGCKSHYWIEQSRIRWSFPLSSRDLRSISKRDQVAAEKHFANEVQAPSVTESTVPPPVAERKTSVLEWITKLFRGRD